MSKNTIIAIIIAIVMGAVGFYVGTIYEKSSLNKKGLLRSAASFGNRQFGQNNQGGQMSQDGQRPNRQGGPGMGREQGDGFLGGEITAKDDKSITIKDRDGSSKIVFFSDATTVGKMVDGSAADLNTGQQVMVKGKTNSDGTIAAENIQIRPVPANN